MTVERDEGFRAGACELVKRQLDPACGCTEEEWETPWGYLGLHLSAGKPSDACLDDGEGEREITLTVATVDEARSAIFGWASALLPANAGQPDGGVEELRKQVAAYRLLAVNESWVHRMADAYGHAEYARQRIAEVDARAARTIASGYDAQKWLDDHALAASAPAAREGE